MRIMIIAVSHKQLLPHHAHHGECKFPGSNTPRLKGKYVLFRSSIVRGKTDDCQHFFSFLKEKRNNGKKALSLLRLLALSLIRQNVLLSDVSESGGQTLRQVRVQKLLFGKITAMLPDWPGLVNRFRGGFASPECVTPVPGEPL